MATPALTSYSVGTGQPIHGGRWPGGRLYSGVELDAVAPAGTLAAAQSDVTGNVTLDVVAPAGALSNGMPAWWNAATVGQWVAISGTAGPGAGLNTNAFSDLTIDPATSRVYAVASGGHANGSSNAAAVIDLSIDFPTWTTLRSASTPTADVLYYADGRPTSRHTYHHTHYIASLNAVLLAGCRFGYGPSTPTGPGLDLFDVAAGDYLPRYTWPDLTPWAATGYGVVQDGSGNVWTHAGYKINGSTGVVSKPGSGSLLRYPAAYDSTRDRIFAMQYDDGEGFATVGFQAKELDPNTGNSQSIAFNSSSAKTAFDAAAPAYSGMAFCPLDGKFYFMSPAAPQTLYVVTPNGTTTWDMTTLTVGGSTLPTISPAILCKRFLWVEQLSGFVVQTDQSSNLHFLRMV